MTTYYQLFEPCGEDLERFRSWEDRKTRPSLKVFLYSFHSLFQFSIYHSFSYYLGASTTVICALSPDILSGSHYADCQVETRLVHEHATDPTAWRRLWEVSEQMVESKKKNVFNL
jgi:hypothetical protein